MTTEQNKLADKIEQVPVGPFAILLGLNDGTHFKDVVAARGMIVAALRAAGEPGAWPAGLPTKREIRKLIEDFVAPDSDTERAFASHRRSWIVQCLQALLSQATQPAPSASVREALEEAANIANRFGDCPGSFVADRIMEFAADTDATPSPLMAAGEADETAPELTSDFAKALPGGPLDDSTYSAIEDALDAIDAPMTEGSRYMTLVERIMALRAAAGEAAPQASAESATPPNWIDAAALQAAHEIVALPENWSYLRRKAAIQVIVAREMMRAHPARDGSHSSRIDASVRASETVEATSPAKRDYAARAMGVSAAPADHKVADWLCDQARIATDSLHCGDNSTTIRQAHNWASELEAVAQRLRSDSQAMAEPTREEIAAIIERHIPHDEALNMAAAILALKPRGGTMPVTESKGE